MAKLNLLLAPALLACASIANAADQKVSVSTEQTSYSGGFGKRLETSVESTTDLGRTGFTVNVAHGKRDIGDDHVKSLRLGATVYHDWSDKFYTRTTMGISSNKPVFATRELAHDFNYKLLPNAVATVGAKYARYHGGVDVLSWSAGASWYFKGGFVSYRFSTYDVDRLGKNHAHLASFRLKDPKGEGYTQLWAGAGSSLHDQEVLLAGSKGKFRSLALQRVQPLRGPVSVNLSLGRAWYDTPTGDYRGTTASVGLAISGWPKL
jgi:YaiO family outer membrane protein